MPVTPLLTPREAARMLGISYASIKQWILTGKLKTTQTPGGHHRIAQAALKPFLAKDSTKPIESRERFQRISGRNQLAGWVVDLRVEGLLAEVILKLDDGSLVTSIITSAAVRELALKKGDHAAALIKSTDIMIERLGP